jgi:hypothetical protein
MNGNIYIMRANDGAVFKTAPCKCIDASDIISMQKEHRLLLLKLRNRRINEAECERMQELENTLLDCLEEWEQVGGCGIFETPQTNLTMLNF